MILDTAGQFPASAPVDLEFIGHSEGTVINTYAIAKLQREMTPQLDAGFIKDTLLDPHAANNDLVTGKQISDAGAFGGLARLVITSYQGEAKDPPAYFPSAVDVTTALSALLSYRTIDSKPSVIKYCSSGGVCSRREATSSRVSGYGCVWVFSAFA